MAARTWIADTPKNWNDATAWDGGATVPQVGDASATFNATHVGNCTANNIGAFVGTITVSGYTGTITQSASVSGVGAFSITSGTWDCATFSFSIGTNTFSCTGGTFNGGTAATTTGAVTFNSTGTIIATSNTWSLGGSWTQSGATTTFTHSSGTVTITAASTFNDTRSAFNKCSVNGGGSNIAVTISASTTFPLGATPTTSTGTSTFSLSGTLTYSGLWTHTGQISAGTGSTTTGTGSPSISVSSNLTISATATSWTSVNITTVGTSASTTYTDTAAKNSGVWTINKGAGGLGFTVAASTTCDLGTNPTSTLVTGTFTVNGTLTYAGTWQHTGHLVTATSSTVTGSSTPTLRIDGNLTIGALATGWTSVDVLVNGSTNASAYTDTAAKNTGIWTITRSAGSTFTIAASTICNLGSTPTSTTTTGNSFVVNGTVQWSGLWTHTGTLSTGAAAVFTGTSTPALTINGSNLTISATATITNAIGTITLNSTTTCTVTDTGDKLSGTTYVLGSSAAKNITIAASTICRIGATPTSNMLTGTLTVTGELRYSGVWTHSGNITVSATTGTVTGSSTPSLVLANAGSLNIATTATWTSVNITAQGTGAGALYTDSATKNSGVWTLSGCSTYGIVAGATMALGATPTISMSATTQSLNVSGTVTWSGLLTTNAGIATGAGGVITATGSPTIVMGSSLTINATSTVTNAISSISFTGTAASIVLTDTADKLSATTYTINKTSSGFTVAAGTICRVGANPTTATSSNTFTITGTFVYSGNWVHNGAISLSGSATITGTSTPTLTLNNALTINATGIITNAIGTITLNASGVTQTITDSADKLSGSIYVIAQGGSGATSLAAGTTMRLGSNPTSSTGTGTFTISGTVLYSGAWVHTGIITTASGSTVTGSSSPSLSCSGNLTINATTTSWSVGNVTFTGSTLQSTYTDTGAKHSGTITFSKGVAANGVVAASTTANIGANPSSTCTLTVTGTLLYSGAWTHNGTMTTSASSTVTGSSSPSLAIFGNLTINATATAWTSVNILAFGASTTVYTDTANKNSGIWTITKSPGSFTVAANTTCNIGTNPTTFCTLTDGSNLITVFGTLLFAGNWRQSGLLTVASGSTLTGTSSPTLSITDNLSVSGIATITNPIPSITILEGPSTFAYDDAGDKLSGSLFYVNKTFGTSVGIQVSTAGTIMRLAPNQTCNVGVVIGITVNVNTQLRYSGTLTVNGIIVVNGTMTGTGTPRIICPLSITIDPAATWTSVDIEVSNAIPATSATYTDTGHKNTGTWLINKQGIFVIAANSVANLGANPTVDCTGSTFVVSGTAQLSGLLTMKGSISTAATGTLSGALTDVFVNQGTWQVAVGTVFPAGLNITYYRTTSGSNNFHSIDGAVYGTFRLYGPGNGLTTFIGSSTFDTIRINEGEVARTVKFTAGTIQSANNWLLAGAAGRIMTISSTSAGVPFTLHSTGAATDIYMSYISFQDCTVDAAPPAWHAGAFSVDVSGNFNILFDGFIPFDSDYRSAIGARTVQATQDHPSGLFLNGAVMYAMDKIKIFIPDLVDPDKAYEFPFDEMHFDDYFVTTVPEGPIVVSTDILTYTAFDSVRRAEIGARQVRALQDSPTGLFATNDVIYAQHKFAIYIPNPMDADEACRFDFDGGLFDDYFEDV